LVMVRPPREFVALVTGAARVHGTRLPLPCLNVIVMVLAPSVLARADVPAIAMEAREVEIGIRSRGGVKKSTRGRHAAHRGPRRAQFAANIRERVGAQPPGPNGWGEIRTREGC